MRNVEISVDQNTKMPAYVSVYCAILGKVPFKYTISQTSAVKNAQHYFDVWDLGFGMENFRMELSHKVPATGSVSYFFDNLSHSTLLNFRVFPCKNPVVVVSCTYNNGTAFMLSSVKSE